MKIRKDELVEKILDILEESRIVKIFKEMLIIASIVVAVLSIVSAIVLYKTDFIKKLKDKK